MQRNSVSKNLCVQKVLGPKIFCPTIFVLKEKSMVTQTRELVEGGGVVAYVVDEPPWCACIAG